MGAITQEMPQLGGVQADIAVSGRRLREHAFEEGRS